MQLRKLIPFSVLVVFHTIGWAQDPDTLLFESFENLPDWTVVDGDGDGFSWGYIRESQNDNLDLAHTGDVALFISTFRDIPNNDIVYTPVVLLPSDEESEIHLWMRNGFSTVAETLDVEVFSGAITTPLQTVIAQGSGWSEFTISLDGYQGESVRIRLHNTSAGAFYLTVDDLLIQTVPLIPQTITVLLPNGGEQLNMGSIYDIQWEAIGSDQVSIDYSPNGGTNWAAITTSTPNDGSYLWTVPQETTTTGLIRTSLLGTDVADESDSLFSILQSPVRYSRIEFYHEVSPSDSNQLNLVGPGETVRFKLQIENDLGTNILTGTTTIDSDDPNVTITDNSANINNISSGGKSWTLDEFEVVLAANTPSGYSPTLSVKVEQQLSPTGPWFSTFSFPVVPLIVSSVLMDDDGNPDSQGDNDDVVEAGETVEVIPLLTNSYSDTLYDVSGILTTAHDFISIWNNHQGASGTVSNNYRYNVQSNVQQPISAGASSIQPEADFVFSVSSPNTNVVEFELIIEAYFGGESGTSWELGGIMIRSSDSFQLVSASTVNIAGVNIVPMQFELHPAYPNPFNPRTSIRFSLPYRTATNISIYDVTGKLVQSLFDAHLEAGEHVTSWDGRDQSRHLVPSGVYFARLVTPGSTKSTKLVLLK